MSKPRLDWGSWNAICDVCGFQFKSSEMKKRWDQLMVCPQDYELRNPQDYIKVRGDITSVPWTRPDDETFSGPACFVFTSCGYTNLGVAGCMQAGQTNQQTSTFLWEMQWPQVLGGIFAPQIVSSGMPGLGLPGKAIPGVIDPLVGT